MKLLCDHMLGTLAKWLRFMGYDTAYPGPLDDTALIETAKREGRVLITRDKELASRLPGTIRVRSDDLEEQIREVASALDLRVIDPLSRCSLCNAILVPVGKEELAERVPEGVRERHDRFWRCPSCDRVYWQGSHWDKMIERLNRLPVRTNGSGGSHLP